MLGFTTVIDQSDSRTQPGHVRMPYTVFIVINAPGRCIFQKGGGGGGGGGAAITDKQNHISSPVAIGDNGHWLP